MPAAPRRYRFGGWVLAFLVITYALALWLAALDLWWQSSVAVYPIAVLGVEALVLLAVDVHGFTSLAGSLPRPTGWRLLLVVLMLLPVWVVPYLVLVTRDHYRATGLRPRQQWQDLWDYLNSKPGADRHRNEVLVGVVCVVFVLSCVLTSADLIAASGAPGAQATPTPGTAAQVITSVARATLAPQATATPKPTATATAQPTDTPVPPPTATSVPQDCAVICNPWGYDFSPGNLIYNPASGFCGVFPCIANFSNGSGYVVECSDGKYSLSGGRQGACSSHGGVRQALYSH
jgi:hypothetical protein